MNWEDATFEVRKARTDPYLSAEVAAVAIVAAALGDKVLYKVGPDGPYDLTVDNGVVIENITDDLVNGGILVCVWPEGGNE